MRSWIRRIESRGDRMSAKREFIMKELMVAGFIEKEKCVIHLEETDKFGESRLEFHLNSDENLCIRNIDKKNTEMYFFQADGKKSMFKRVDHIIFEHADADKWNLHLIEMKSSVGAETWADVKGKFRASYLLAQGIAAMLDINITETYMYTIYEEIKFTFPKTMPSARRTRSGVPLVRPEKEWSGEEFGLNFGTRLKFSHKPVHMARDSQNVLVGEYGLDRDFC